MHRAQALTFLCLLCVQSSAAQARFSGESALELTRKVVGFGPRPVASDAHRRLERFLIAQAKSYGCTVSEDVFQAPTPLGPKRMNNIIARPAAARGRDLVILTGHYDTKIMPGTNFLGANDGGSSTGLLLELARTLCAASPWSAFDVWIVWLDGEEALAEWSDTDSLYGSRRLAAQWSGDGTLRRARAVINVDMIGDRNLVIASEANSTPWLRELFHEAAASLGYARHFSRDMQYIVDDHIPFLRAGAAAIDVIDFDYGPDNSYWHTARDTMDKLSASSFEVAGRVLLDVLRRLDTPAKGKRR